jgi:hypothetical protein
MSLPISVPAQTATPAGAVAAASTRAANIENYLQVPLAFERQADKGSETFVARGQGYKVGVRGTTTTIGVVSGADNTKAGASGSGTKSRSITIDFQGARKVPALLGPETSGKVNYILGNDPKKWRLGVSTYKSVAFPETYPGVDLVYYGNQKQLEFDLVVKPGADPRAIRMKIGGGEHLSVDSTGALKIGESEDAIRIALPKIYQELNGARRSVSGRYVVRGNSEVAFALDTYDRSRALVIDPTIVYSALLGGGTDSTFGQAVAVDASGDILVTGNTYAQDFPTVNPAQAGLSVPGDVFVTKINAAGTALIYSTYIGGSSNDYGNGIAVDSNGAAWITGETASTDFPLLNAAQATYGANNGANAFVTRLNASGALQFSTFLGGSNYTWGQSVAVDGSGNGYVTGGDTSGSFPTTAGVFQPTSSGGGHAFATKYSPAGVVLYSTYLGGNSTDYGYGIAVDSAGDAYVTGYSDSGTFTGAPAGGAQTANNGNGDAFVAKLNPSGSALLYFTFLGGANLDEAKSIAIDGSSPPNAYIAGYTSSTGLATASAAQTTLAGGQDGFIAKLNGAGTAFTYVTYLGGNRTDQINGITVDSSGNAYVAGQTESNNFPSVSAIQSLPGNGISLFQTTNTGTAWSAFDSNIPGAVQDISQNPSNPNSIVVSTDSGIYRTANGGTSWSFQSGNTNQQLSRSPANPSTIYSVYVSSQKSIDDGATWTPTGGVPSCCATNVLADPLTATTAYTFGPGIVGVAVTTNGGTTWAAASGLPGTSVAAMAAGSDGAVYAGVQQFGIYKTTNQGGTWTAINNGLGSNVYPNQHSIAVSPANPSTLYFASGGIYQSTNGGASWSYLSGLPSTSSGAYQVAVSASNSSVVYATTYTGQVFVSSNGGVSWTAAFAGLTAPNLNEIVVDPTNGAHAFVVANVPQTGFVAELNAAGTSLLYSTYLGGNSATYAYGIAAAGLGKVFVTGYAAGNSGFPATTTAFGPTNSYNAFVTAITTSTAACSYAVLPGSTTLPGYSSTLMLGVVAPSGCAWTASSNQAWATVTTGVSGTGSGPVTVQVASNSTGSTRTATVTISGQTVTITQADGSCGFSLSQQSFTLTNAGGAVSTNLTTGAGCPWVVTNNFPSVISITSGGSGTGNGTINLNVAPNHGLNATNFNLSVGNTSIHIVEPGTCTFVLNPGSASPTSAGGPGLFTVTPSNSACTWNASSSNSSWLTITSGSNGTGNGTVNYSVAANTGTAQSAAITIPGAPVFTVSQAAAPLSIVNAANLGTFTSGTLQLGLGANGATGAYVWSLQSGALPTGLSLRTDVASLNLASNFQAGLIGVATTPGTYHFTLGVASGGQNASLAFTMRITGLNVQDQAVGFVDAFVGNAYFYQLTQLNAAAGGIVTFTQTSATVPGLTLSSSGVLSGTPTAAGTYNVSFNLSDGTDTINRTDRLVISAIDITSPGALPNATQGAVYSQSLTATGGTGSYTWAVTNGNLPGGLSLSVDGAITGTVTFGPSMNSFNATATDSNGVSYTKTMMIDVIGVPPAVNRITLGYVSDGVVGNGTEFQVASCCGGTAPFTWTATGLPAGMSVRSGSGNTSTYIGPGWAEVWGIPQTAGTYSVLLTAIDVNGAKSSISFLFNVSVLDHTPGLPSGTINTPYNNTLRVIGGTPPYTVTQVLPQSNLPSGVTVNVAAVQLNGTPIENGNFNANLVYTDSASNTLSRQDNFFIAGGAAGSNVSINNTGSLGTIGLGNYSNQLSACCVAAYTWTQTGGLLPPGITLSAGGLLSGTATSTGVYTFLVKAADNANVASPGFRQFTLTVSPISITTNSLPYGNLTVAYSASLTATGGTGALTWTLSPNNFLPPGVSLASNGTFSGTPTATGQYGFTVTVMDTAGHTATPFFAINVYPAGAFPPVSTGIGTSLGTWTTGTDQIALSASGGTGTYTWSLVAGALPPGLAIRTDVPSYFSSNQQAGLIGVATTAGTYSFTLKVTSGTQSFTQATSVRITALNIADNAITLPDAFVGTPYNAYQFTALNGAAAVTFTSTNTLPPGMGLSSSGILSGTPTAAGNYSVNFSITDGTDAVNRSQNFHVYAINITSPGVLPNVTQGNTYTQGAPVATLTATGGSGSYTWTYNCCLPGGLSLNTSGVIYGTVTGGTGIDGFTVTATDTNNVSYSKVMSIDTIGVPVGLPDIYASFPNYDAVVGDGFSWGIYVGSGGTAPFAWTATGLPAGMMIHTGRSVTSPYLPPDQAEIWGIPQTPGTYNIQFTVTDVNGLTATQTLPLHVSVLDINPGPSNGTIGSPYSATLRALGGTVPYTSALVPLQPLPDGLTFNTSTFQLSGTPLESGSFNLDVKFTDSASNTIFRTMGFNISNGLSAISVGTGSNLGPYLVGTSPTITLSACCVASYNWSVVSGTPPPGQTLTNGVLGGNLTTIGTYTFLIKAVDTSNAANTAFRQITEIVSPMTITTGSLTFGNVGVAYTAVTLAATGGAAPLTWTLNNLNYLPPGLTLTSGGVISGTPTATGDYPFNVTVTDANGNTATHFYLINVYANGAFPPVAISNGANLGTWPLGTDEFLLNATGGTGTYTWSVAAGSTLPAGFAIRTDTVGYLNGGPGSTELGFVAVTPGTYPFILNVTSGTQTVSRAFTITVTSLEAQDSNLPDGFAGVPYSYQFMPIGNTGPVTFTGNNLPAGLTMSSSGKLTGTIAPGSYTIQFNLSDSVNTVFGHQQQLNIYAVQITTPGLLPNATQNANYTSPAIVATGGTAPYMFTVNCCLPSGLSLNATTGVISGTVTSGPGLSTFAVTATDANNNAYTKQMSIGVIGVPLTLPEISVGEVDDPTVGDQYGWGIGVFGGTPPYTWSATGLPNGMSVRSGSGVTSSYLAPGDAEIYGVSLVAGSFNPTLTVTDSAGATSTVTFPLHISLMSLRSQVQSSTNMPNGTINTRYSFQLRLLGGSGSYSIAQQYLSPPDGNVGELPDGVTVNTSTLVVSGTPLENGTFRPLYGYSDGSGNTLKKQSQLQIGDAPSTININNNGTSSFDLGTATVGVSYSTTFSSGSVPSLTWTAASALPPGLSLNSGTGVLSGTPTTTGVYYFLVGAADATNAANTGFRQFKLTVTPIAITTANPLPHGNAGTAYSQTFTATGGTGTLTWSLVPFNILPTGMSLSAAGVLTGSPSTSPLATGQYNFSVMVTDTNNNTAIRGYTLSIYGPGSTPPLFLGFGPNLTFARTTQTQQLSATGGTPPYHYSLSPGATPVPGFRVQDNGQPMPNGFPAGVGGFLGVATTAGTYNTSIRVTDSLGATFDRPITLTVLPQVLVNQSNLPKALVGTPYSFQLVAGGGSGTYSFSASNTLPSWLTLSASGLLSGTPTAGSAGTVSINVVLADAAVANTITYTQTLTVDPFAITDAGVLPPATIGVSYTYTFNAAGCGSGCTWTGGSFLGLTFSSAGVLSGTPTGNGTASFPVQAAGSNGTVQKIVFFSVPPTGIQALSITNTITTSNTIGTLGTFSTLTAIGGTPPYAWAVTSGNLPPGITLQGTGETLGSDLSPGRYYLAGRATAVGNYTFTLQVTDANSLTATKTLTLPISPLSIQYTSLPITGTTMVYNQPYTQQMLVIGGSGTYNSFTTPVPIYPGLTLNGTTGIITGTPTNAGSLTTAWTVTDSATNTATTNVSINAASGGSSTITLSGPAYGTVFGLGGATTYTLVSSAYVLSPLSALPAGVTVVNGKTLTISPEVPGTYTFTLQAKDSGNNVVAVSDYTVVFTDFTTILTNSLPNASVSTPYSAQLYSFGTGAAPAFALAAGSALPPGLTISSAGLISGTPTQAGTFLFSTTISDATGLLTNSYTLIVSPFTITNSLTPARMLPTAIYNVPYSYQMTASGGSGLTWSATGLPTGLSISSSGLITGIPTSGTARFTPTITVTDGVSPFSLQFTFFVRLSSTPIELTLTGGTLTDTVLGRSYSTSILPSGGIPPYTIAVATGSTLPPGLSLLTGAALASNAAPAATTLTGTPTTAGTYTFSLKATDSAGTSTTVPFTLKVGTISLTTGNPVNAIQGVAYNQQLTATGGSAPYSFAFAPASLSLEALPPGLNLSSTGLISGTPLSTGSYSFKVTVTDNAGKTYTPTLALLSLNSAGAYISSGNFTGDSVGVGFSQTLAVATTVANAPATTYTWSLPSGAASLPTGMSLTSAGVLQGTPSSPGIYSYTARATDTSSAATVDHVFNLIVSSMHQVAPVTKAYASPSLFPFGNVGTAYSFTMAVAGGTGPYTYSTSPLAPLPPGLSLSSAGVLSGTPTASGSFGITVIVTDAGGSANSLLIGGTLVIAPVGQETPIIPDTVYFSQYSMGVPTATNLDSLVYGGTKPYTWTTSSGIPGFTNFAGSNGTSSYAIGAATTLGPNPYTFIVTDANGQAFTYTGSLTNSPIAVTPETASPAVTGIPYSLTIVPSGGTAPYTIQQVVGWDMPPGLRLTGNVISGTPTSPGNYVIRLTIADSASNTLSRFYPVSVDNPAGQAPAVSIAQKPINVFYQIGAAAPTAPVQINTTSGAPVFNAYAAGITGMTLSATGGTAPAALTLNFSGAPLTTPGTYYGFVAISSAQSIKPNDSTPVILTVAAAPPCVFSLNPSSASFDYNSGTGSFNLAASSSCGPWTATSDPSVTITSAVSGTGSATINYSIAVNPSGQPQRTPTISVAGQTFTITQFAQPAPTFTQASCSFTISPSTINTTSVAGSALVNIAASDPRCTWTATSATLGLPVVASGTGSQPLTVGISANPTAVLQTSTATITGVTFPGVTLTVNQTGTSCSDSATFLSQNSSSVGSAASTGGVTLTTPNGCTYNTVNGPSWITVTSNASGTASAAGPNSIPIGYSIAANSTTVPRTGSVTIDGIPYQITQQGLACSISLDTSGLASPFAQTGAGSGTINVNVNGPNCSWSVVNNASFANVSPTSGTGAGSVGITMKAANAAASAQTGSISISGQTVSITQAGVSCATAYSLRSPSGNAPPTGGSGSVGLVAPAACTWSVGSDSAWLTVTPPTASAGTADIQFTALANAGAARQGTLTVTGLAGASLTYILSQAAAPCTYNLAAASASTAAAGVTNQTVGFTVATGAGCTLTPVSYAAWITSVSTVGGNVQYTVQPNVLGSARSGSIQVGDKLFTVNQQAALGTCTYSLNAYGAAYGQTGGSGNILGSQSANGCAAPGVSTGSTFITVNSPLATGPVNNIFTDGYVVINFSSATPAVRRATITFGGQIYTIKQTSW